MYKYFPIIIFLLFVSLQLKSENDTVKYDVSLMGLASSGEYAPFWLQSRQYGKTSLSANSANLLLGFTKDFSSTKSMFDYSFKASLLLQTNNLNSQVYFQELYAKARLFVFDMTIGAREEILGNQDSTLSCGGLLFSKNARPMQKITVGIERFTAIPFTRGYLEIKGALSHGWFSDNLYSADVLLHHKYAYLRLGGRLPVHFQFGLDHVAQWGGNVPNFGQQPTSLKDYVSIFFGNSGGSDASIGEQINALGNHIISQSARLDADISDFKVSAYWQNISEDGPIRFITNTMNIPDGLWGISIRNSKFSLVKGLLYEYLNTTDQSGPYHDKDGIIYGGADSYFTNWIFRSGWTYYSRTIGTPFISSPLYNKNGEVNILNNRVQVHHVGIEGDVAGYSYKILSSFAKNYGTYLTPYTEMKPNKSFLLEVSKHFEKLQNIDMSCSIGGDFGNLYGNSVGCLFTIRKTGDLFHY